MSNLLISEVFGPTVQGEGPHTGQRAAFVRLGGCNLTCSWCDTPYTWDASRFSLRDEMTRWPVADVVDKVEALDCALTVISGGEPLLQQDRNGSHTYGLEDLVHGLVRRRRGHRVDVETNGTITPTSRLTKVISLFVVSPKLDHAGMTHHDRLRPGPLHEFTDLAHDGRAVFKFVIKQPSDLADVVILVDGLGIPRSSVWLMPEGTTADMINSRALAVVEAALSSGFNYSTRLHVALWGTERAR